MSARFCLPLGFCLLTASVLAQNPEPRPPAEESTRETTNVPAVRFLLGTVAEESFDGATLTRVVFPNGSQTLRYSPPRGWKIKPGQRLELTQGDYKASLTLGVAPSSSSGASSEAELRASRGEVLPWQISGRPVEKTSAPYTRGGYVFNRSTIRSLGGDWQVELILEGPADGFAAVEERLSATLLSVSLETQADSERRAQLQEKQVVAQMARERHAASRPPPTGPVRGKLVD